MEPNDLRCNRTGIVGAIAICNALTERASKEGSYNIDASLTQFNNWYIRSLRLHDEETRDYLRTIHPEFHPVHDTELELIAQTIKITRASNGDIKEALRDLARWSTGLVRWGKEGEIAIYLDWRRVEGNNVIFGFDSGSCFPGSDQPVWL